MSFGPTVPARARLALHRVLLAALAMSPVGCLVSERWGDETDFIVGREGIINTFHEPGPNPTGTSGIEKNVPPLTEDNAVEVRRVAGTVGVRAAGERGVRNLEYYRTRFQAGPYGVVLTGPNSVAYLNFADDSIAVLQHTGLARLGDAAHGEPRLICSRLTRLEFTQSAEPKLGGVEIPGGVRIEAPAFGRFKVELERDRYYRVTNDGKAPVELRVDGMTHYLRPAQRIDLPALRNAPSGSSSGDGHTIAAAGVVEASGGTTVLGGATFSAGPVDFDPLQPRIEPQTPSGGR